MQLRTVWSDYFTGTPTSLEPNVYVKRQTPSGTSVYVSNCLFGSITSSSAGGALYCYYSVTYLLVESSSFFTCATSNSQGGAIYFYNTGSGQCVLHEVCGYDCYSTCTGGSQGQFAYIYANDGALGKNYVNYSSILRCVYTSYNTHNLLELCNGNICLPSVNISLNKIYSRSAVVCYPLVVSNFVTCSLSYSSFADNFATQSGCIQLWRSGAKSEVKSCNVLRNTQGTLSDRGTFYVDGNMMIEDCCILENRATYIFCLNSGTVTLSNCTVDSTSSNGNVVMTKTVIKSFIHALNHMSTRDCYSEYDSAGTLTPIIQTPSSTKKQICYYTCMRLFYQRPQVDLISLISFLIFNFIHPYASIYPL